MQYRMEELVPIVLKLSERYISGNSSSISYEKAQQFMEAVLYSIQEGEKTRLSLAEVQSDEAFFSENLPLNLQQKELTAEQAYEYGSKCVEEKVKEALSLYNRIIVDFDSFGCRCLYDTVVKGLPEFFRRYDTKYDPQNTILTLDYPVLMEKTEDTGIDRVYEYLLCIRSECTFLKAFPSDHVREVLAHYDRNYRLMIDNISEIVLTDLLVHMLAGKGMENLHYDQAEYEKLQLLLQTEDLLTVRERLKESIDRIVQSYFENDEKLKCYLKKAAENIAVRIKAAADSKTLKKYM